jgi:hypothetical protein
MFDDESQFIRFARTHLSEAFPNAERRGCPSMDALRTLAQNPTKCDAPLTNHLTTCSPCFNEYIAHLDRAKLRSRRTRRFRNIELSGVIAFAVVLLFVLAVRRHYIPGAAVGGRELAAKDISLTIDLQNASPARGTAELSTNLSPPAISSSPSLDLTFKLPIGSRDEKYSAQLTSNGSVIWSQSARPNFENRQMLLHVHADFSHIRTGAYDLAVVAEDFRITIPVLIKRPLAKASR